MAHRVPASSCRRARDRRRRRRHERGAAGRRAGGRRGARRRRAGARRDRAPGRSPRSGRRAGAARPRRRGRGAGSGRRARLLRRHRPRLDAEHAAPDPGRAPHRGHRLDRAAADVRGQRPAGGDAVLGRAAARLALRRPSGQGGRHRDDGRPGPGVRPRAPRRRGRDRRPRRLALQRRKPGAGRADRSGPHPAAAGQRGDPRRRPPRAGDRSGRRRARSGRPRARRHRARSQLRSGRRLRAAPFPRPRCCCRPAARRAGTRPPAPTSRRRCRRGSTPPGPSPATPRAAKRSSPAWSPGRRRRSRSSSARRPTALASSPNVRPSPRRRVLDRGRPGPRRERARAQGEVLRLPLRGRHHQGHQLLDRRGLRLARAAQALHDGDDGPVPGPHVPARGDPADGGRHRSGRRRRGHDDRAAALVHGPDGRAGGPPVRAREALRGPRASPGARRQRHVGRRLAPALRLRRSGGRDDGGPRECRADRRLDARQAHRRRTGRRRLPQPPLPEPVRQREGGSDPLRRARRRRRADHRRRDRRAPRRRLVLRDHDLERCRRRRELVRVVAGRVGHGRAPHRCQPGPLRLQPRRPTGPGDPGRPHRSGLLERVVRVPRRQASPGRGGSMPVAADRLRRRARVRAALPGGACRAPVGRDDGGRRAARDQAVRARAPARAAAAEAPHPGRPGHRRRVEPARGGDALDRQVRQGGGLHRPLGPGGGQRAGQREHARGIHGSRRRGAGRGGRGAGRRASRRAG